MEARKAYRIEQQKVRLAREKERQEREKAERERIEMEEQRKKEAEEAKKKAAIANMSAHYGGYLNRQSKGGNNRKQTAREQKREALAKRRKPLNIDHLNTERLISKAKELSEYQAQLENERWNAEDQASMQKWQITSLRQRVQEFVAKSGKGPKKMVIKIK